MRPLFPLAVLIALPSAASASELFGGIHAQGVKTPLSLEADRESGAAFSLGIRGGGIGGTFLEPYAFASVNSRGRTNFLAAGVSARWVHFSHGQLFGKQNPGIDNIGVRLNWRL
jgi:lipid A 3-O-deacylase